MNDPLPGMGQRFHGMARGFPGMAQGFRGMDEGFPGMDEGFHGMDESFPGMTESRSGRNAETGPGDAIFSDLRPGTLAARRSRASRVVNSIQGPSSPGRRASTPAFLCRSTPPTTAETRAPPPRVRSAPRPSAAAGRAGAWPLRRACRRRAGLRARGRGPRPRLASRCS